MQLPFSTGHLHLYSLQTVSSSTDVESLFPYTSNTGRTKQKGPAVYGSCFISGINYGAKENSSRFYTFWIKCILWRVHHSNCKLGFSSCQDYLNSPHLRTVKDGLSCQYFSVFFAYSLQFQDTQSYFQFFFDGYVLSSRGQNYSSGTFLCVCVCMCSYTSRFTPEGML